eukprot:CAMPEP_0194347048 /NCGR_PEP_ID=MMETSP0171-20130528/105771_1 /TAXON_ID=218684 /ORGANISM="Corethron pennatum, Strain L29A3" /LENGTH=629 /DNA_ID=CAMNT_0039114251 /DNA_START=64 /DNA_END=1953 /DNA_ORIENTATION=-
MNVTKETIGVACDEFERLVPTAAFVAMDLEMTGIHLPECKELPDDTPAARYAKMRTVASRFNVVQVGLTTFHRTGGGSGGDEYAARTWNVFTFPARGQIVLEGGAVEFLNNNGMDWNAWFQNGVPYLRRGAAAELAAKLLPADGSSAVAAAAPGPPMQLDRPEDAAVCADALAGVAEWWARGRPRRRGGVVGARRRRPGGARASRVQLVPAALPLPGVRARLRGRAGLRRRVARPRPREKLGEADGGAAPECGGARGGGGGRAGAAERDERARLGFRRMWTALTGAGRPLVVHNGLFDLLFMCAHMHDDLPASLAGFKELIGELFPAGVYDTRTVGKKMTVVAEVDPDADADADTAKTHDGKDQEDEAPARRPMFPELRLDRLYACCKSEAEASVAAAADGGASRSDDDTRIVVRFAEGHDRYKDPSKAILHEAGYDSYITAFCFAYMRRFSLQQRGASDLRAASVGHLAEDAPWSGGRGGACASRRGAPTPSSAAPGEQRHVLTGFPAAYRTSDALRLFAACPVVDGAVNPRVTLQWINDTMLCACVADADAGTVLANFEAHRAALVAEGAQADAGVMTLTPLADYMRAKDEEAAAAADNNETNTKRTASNGSADEPLPTKRTKEENE